MGGTAFPFAAISSGFPSHCLSFFFHGSALLYRFTLALFLITNPLPSMFTFFHPPNTGTFFSALEFRIFQAPSMTSHRRTAYTTTTTTKTAPCPFPPESRPNLCSTGTWSIWQLTMKHVAYLSYRRVCASSVQLLCSPLVRVLTPDQYSGAY
jgi:hypothetical protein